MKFVAVGNCCRNVVGAGRSAKGDTGVPGGVGSSVDSDGITLSRRRQGRVGVRGGVGSDGITLSRRPQGELIVG